MTQNSPIAAIPLNYSSFSSSHCIALCETSFAFHLHPKKETKNLWARSTERFIGRGHNFITSMTRYSKDNFCDKFHRNPSNIHKDMTLCAKCHSQGVKGKGANSKQLFSTIPITTHISQGKQYTTKIIPSQRLLLRTSSLTVYCFPHFFSWLTTSLQDPALTAIIASSSLQLKISIQNMPSLKSLQQCNHTSARETSTLHCILKIKQKTFQILTCTTTRHQKKILCNHFCSFIFLHCIIPFTSFPSKFHFMTHMPQCQYLLLFLSNNTLPTFLRQK